MINHNQPQGDADMKTFTFFASFILTNSQGEIVGDGVQHMIRLAKKTGIDTKTIRLTTDGAGIPTFELEAITPQFWNFVYEMSLVGFMEDFIDIPEDEFEATFLKAT
jgi:hypothetical protein